MSHSRNTPWRMYLELFDGSRRQLALTLVIAVGQALLLVPIAKLVQHAFDHQIPHRQAGAVALTGLIILVLYVANAALGLLTRYISLKVVKAAVTQLRIKLTRRLYAMAQAELDRSSVGELQSIVVQDSERVDAMSNALVALLLPAAVISVGLMVVALVLSPLLCAALLAVVPIMYVANRRLAGVIRRRTRRWQRAFDAFASATALGLRAMSLTKVHSAEPIEVERRSTLAVELEGAGREMAWAGGAYAITQQSVSACAGVIVLIIGGWSTARGDMTLGQLLGFYAVAALLLRQVSVIVANIPSVLSGYESVARLNALLESGAGEPYTGARVVDFCGNIAFDSVSFAYDRDPVLLDVDLSVQEGEHVAVIGPNGAGKSTLVSLLLGLYRPTSGRVLAEGVPFDELDVRALRQRIGVVLQDPVIFPGTVRENIAYGRTGASEAEIRRAAELATAADFAESLPQGYDTPVGDEGVLLSAGQRQRVAIARSLLASPSLLILDEPTAHLDHASITRLMDTLGGLPGSPTVIAVSHDSEIESWADRIVHLRDGRMASAVGTAGEVA